MGCVVSIGRPACLFPVLEFCECCMFVRECGKAGYGCYRSVLVEGLMEAWMIFVIVCYEWVVAWADAVSWLTSLLCRNCVCLVA